MQPGENSIHCIRSSSRGIISNRPIFASRLSTTAIYLIGNIFWQPVFVYLLVSPTISKFEDLRMFASALTTCVLVETLIYMWTDALAVMLQQHVNVKFSNFIFDGIFSSIILCFVTRYEWQPKAAISL